MYPLTLLNLLIRYLHKRVMYSLITLLYWATLGFGSHLEGALSGHWLIGVQRCGNVAVKADGNTKAEAVTFTIVQYRE